MKDHFIRLFNYDHYANQIIASAIRAAHDPEKTVQLMAHLLGAQQVWFSRCNADTAFSGVIWPGWQADAFDQLITDNHQAWINYLNTLNNADLEKEISYKNSKGVAFKNKLIDILTQVINHGTHHRAQIGQQLKFTGADLPGTDYILYIRDLKRPYI